MTQWRTALRSISGRTDMRVEIVVITMAAIGVATSLLSAPPAYGWLGGGLACLMLAIAVIDARHFMIPDKLSIAGFALALVNALVERPDAAVEAAAFVVLRGAALAILFLAVRVGYRKLRRREGIGLGDVKLAAVAGAWLGWSTIPIAVEIAAVAALTWYTARQMARERSVERTNRLPFGLFFAPSIWLCWLLQIKLAIPY